MTVKGYNFKSNVYHVPYVTSNRILEDNNSSDFPYIKDLISALVKIEALGI